MIMTPEAAAELLAFIDARIEEDHDTAWGADMSPWRDGSWDGAVRGPREVLSRRGDQIAVCFYGGTYGHILRFDPTRMIAECELKKLALAEWRRFAVVAITEVPKIVLAIARLYSDHPDFKPEWRA